MLHTVVTDITGNTGLKIVRSILAGERDPEQLAAHRDPRCHASHKANSSRRLTGNYRAEHLFALKQNFAAYEFLLQPDRRVRRRNRSAAPQRSPRNSRRPSTALPAARRKRNPKATRPPSTSAPRCIGSPAAPT